MPTFLALHCYKCNMMQVKQEKKSSNKWSCSLCNEKQSVRKVYPTSMAAKDIRKFVQEYNWSHNGAQDRALSEFLLNVDQAVDAGDFLPGNVLCGEYSQARHDFLGDEFNHQQMNVKNKWNEYLPQDEGSHPEVLEEDAVDGVKFFTAMPENYSRKPKGGMQAARSREQYPLLQKVRINERFSSRPSKNVKKCPDATEKENGSPFAWSPKVSFTSSLQVPNPASIQHGQKLAAYKWPQRNVVDAPMQASAAGVLLGERMLLPHKSCESATVASKNSKSLTDLKKPVQRYTACSDGTSQERFGSLKKENCVSKWAKYMDYGEVACNEDSVQSCGPAANEGNFVDVGQEPMQSKEGSSIWSLRAASNTQYFNDLVKTELDELLNVPSLSGEEGGGDEPTL